MDDIPIVVLDTNTFVAAGFNPRSASARILERVKAGALHHRWNEETSRETRYILRKIPPLSRTDLEPFFKEEDRFDGPTEPERFGYVPDAEDRKFLALAAAAGATLISQDDHLLAERDRSPVPILTPGEFLRSQGDSDEAGW